MYNRCNTKCSVVHFIHFSYCSPTVSMWVLCEAAPYAECTMHLLEKPWHLVLYCTPSVTRMPCWHRELTTLSETATMLSDWKHARIVDSHDAMKLSCKIHWYQLTASLVSWLQMGWHWKCVHQDQWRGPSWSRPLPQESCAGDLCPGGGGGTLLWEWGGGEEGEVGRGPQRGTGEDRGGGEEKIQPTYTFYPQHHIVNLLPYSMNPISPGWANTW